MITLFCLYKTGIIYLLLRVVRGSLVIFPGTPSAMFSFVTIIFTGITTLSGIYNTRV